MYDLPDFIKSASLNEIVPPKELQKKSSLFADPRRFLFPCHTRVAAFLSHLDWWDKKAEWPIEEVAEIEARLDRAALFHGLGETIRYAAEEAEKRAQQEKKTSVPNDKDYAIVTINPVSEEKEYFLPINNPANIVKTADWLIKNAYSLPREDRLSIAEKVLDRSIEMSVMLGASRLHSLEKLAQQGTNSTQKIAAALLHRASLCKLEAAHEAFVKMAQTVNQVKQLSNKVAVDLAGQLEDIDRQFGFQYGTGPDEVLPPEEIFFDITPSKAASAADGCLTQTGRFYPRSVLERVKLSDLATFMGNDFADQVMDTSGKVSATKLANLLDELPRPECEQFDKMIDEIGLSKEILIKNSAFSLPKEEWEQLARMYAEKNQLATS